MKLEKLPGGVIYDDDETTRISKADGTMLEAIHRQLAGLAAAAMDEAKRPQFADNGDGTITLTTSATITDAGDGTITIGA